MGDRLTQKGRRDYPTSGAVKKVESGNVFQNVRTTDKVCDPKQSASTFRPFTKEEKEY